MSNQEARDFSHVRFTDGGLIMLVEAEEEKEQLQLANKELSEEVTYKEDVIIGLVKEISVAEKRQRITQIVRYKTLVLL